MNDYPASMRLACAFPPVGGFHGALTTIQDLSNHGLGSRLWCPTKRDAVRLIVEARLSEGLSNGQGNRAGRRAALIEMQNDFEPVFIEPSRTPEALHEMATIGRMRHPGCHEL